MRQQQRWRGAVLVVALAVLAGACGQGSETGSGEPAPVPTATATPDEAPTPVEELESTLDWGPCDDPDGRFECATLPVPLDHANPHGAMIDLALVRLPAPPAADRIGALVVNPGGPGGSGVDLVRYAAVEVFPAEVRTRFDIVGFDPRGVGASGAVTCASHSDTLFELDLVPGSTERWARLTEDLRAFADGCAAHSGDLLDHVTTEDVVADLDRLRAALGESQLTYLGFSYGTRIGALYADRHPDRVRAMVLDGAVDPAQDAVAMTRDQTLALERTFDRFLAECAEVGCALAASGDPNEAYEQVRAAVEASALAAPALGDGRRVSTTELHLAVRGLLRDREHGWPWLAEALADARDGDGSLLAAVVEPAEDDLAWDDSLAALLAVNCTDLPVPAAEDFPALAERLATEAPRFGASALVFDLACAVWPVAPRHAPAPVAAPAAPPLVVVGVTGDPVTPFEWSEALAEQLDARLLTREGARHTAFGGGNVCTDRAVGRYLIDLVLPAPGWSCG